MCVCAFKNFTKTAFFLRIEINLQLIYNVVLGIQQSGSVIRTYISILFHTIFLVGCYKILNKVPFAIQ